MRFNIRNQMPAHEPGRVGGGQVADDGRVCVPESPEAEADAIDAGAMSKAAERQGDGVVVLSAVPVVAGWRGEHFSPAAIHLGDDLADFRPEREPLRYLFLCPDPIDDDNAVNEFQVGPGQVGTVDGVEPGVQPEQHEGAELRRANVVVQQGGDLVDAEPMLPMIFTPADQCHAAIGGGGLSEAAAVAWDAVDDVVVDAPPEHRADGLDVSVKSERPEPQTLHELLSKRGEVIGGNADGQHFRPDVRGEPFDGDFVVAGGVVSKFAASDATFAGHHESLSEFGKRDVAAGDCGRAHFATPDQFDQVVSCLSVGGSEWPDDVFSVDLFCETPVFSFRDFEGDLSAHGSNTWRTSLALTSIFASMPAADFQFSRLFYGNATGRTRTGDPGLMNPRLQRPHQETNDKSTPSQGTDPSETTQIGPIVGAGLARDAFCLTCYGTGTVLLQFSQDPPTACGCGGGQ
jgi:hypothetical protein